MNGYMKCYNCGHDYPKNLLRRGYCSNCFEDGFLEAEAMKEFRESGYGDKPWNFDAIKKEMKVIAINKYQFHELTTNLIAECENMGFNTKIDSELYPEGWIYTKEYVDFLHKKMHHVLQLCDGRINNL